MGGFDVARRRIPVHACAATRKRAGGSRHGVAGLNGLECARVGQITSRFWGLIAMCSWLAGWLAVVRVPACMSESFVSFVCPAVLEHHAVLCIPGWRGAAAASVATLSFSRHVGLGVFYFPVSFLLLSDSPPEIENVAPLCV